jgi:RsiW-degrading membrane proteinase PrsW (M82 family)
MKKIKCMLIVLLLILLVLLLFYSQSEFNKNDYSNSNYLFENYQRFNNTEISFKATIKDVYSANQTILAAVLDYPHTVVTIKNVIIDHHFHKDDSIFVVGILKGEKTVFVEKILVRGPWDDSIIFISSIPAIPFVLYLFFRTWRFNSKTLTFEWRRKDA